MTGVSSTAFRLSTSLSLKAVLKTPSPEWLEAIKDDVTANQANVVPYTFYLPAIDPLNTMINTSGATDVTNARVPGLKMTIPQGVRLRVLGSSADVTQVSITPVPINRIFSCHIPRKSLTIPVVLHLRGIPTRAAGVQSRWHFRFERQA